MSLSRNKYGEEKRGDKKKEEEEKATQNLPQQKNGNRDVITYRKAQAAKHMQPFQIAENAFMFHILDLKLKVKKKGRMQLMEFNNLR